MHAAAAELYPIPPPSIRCRTRECRGRVANVSGRLTGYPEVIAPEQTFNDAGQKSSSRKFAGYPIQGDLASHGRRQAMNTA